MPLLSQEAYSKQPSTFLRDLAGARACSTLAEGVQWLKQRIAGDHPAWRRALALSGHES